MPEEAHQLPPEDQPDIQPDIRPHLRAQEGLSSNSTGSSSSSGGATDSAGGKSWGATSNTGGKVASPTALNDAEATPWTTNLASNLAGNLGGATSVVANAGKLKNFFWGSSKRRKSTLFGGGGAGIVGTVIFVLVITSGSAELIQLDHTLQKNFNPSKHAMSRRLQKLVKKALDAKSNGETTEDKLGAADFQPEVEELAKQGVTFNDNGGSIDAEALSEKYPELKGMSEDARKAWLADKFSLSESDVSSSDKGKSFSINSDGFASSAETFLLGDNSVEILSDGSVLNGISNRIFAKFLNIPDLFHPLNKQEGDQIAGEATDKQRSTIEDEEAAAEASPEEAPGAPDVNSEVSDAESSAKSPGFLESLNISGYGCNLIHLSNDINDIDKFRVELPAIIMGIRVMSMGEQVEAGQDINASQVNALLSSLMNSQGQDIWQGMALQATTGSSRREGIDLSPAYKQTFAGGKVSQAMNTAGGAIVDAATGGTGLIPGAKTLICSSPVQWAANAASAVISVGAAATGVLDGGASDIAEGGTELAIKAGIQETVGQVESAGISLVATSFIDQFILNASTLGHLAKDAFSGPLGGNLLAWGARDAGNKGAVVLGGTALSGTESAVQTADVDQQQEQQFRSESFFARMFNVDDPLSLASHLASSFTPSLTQNVASFAGDFSNIGSDLLSSLSSVFLPKSSAADDPYYWGIKGTGIALPQYGIPDDVLNGKDISGRVDPTMADSYTNAHEVANMLDACSNNGANPGNCWQIQEAQNCFEAVISKTSGVWDVTTSDTPVDTTSNNTPDGSSNCSTDLKTSNSWRRIILFIVDTRTMQSADCSKSNSPTSDQSCQDVGYQTGSGNGSSTSTSTQASGSLPSGTAQDLAKQILANKKITENGGEVTADLQAAAAGQPSTAGKPLSQTLLALIAYMGQNHSFNISALESGGQGHSGPGDPHYEGDAVDITGLDGDPIANSGIGRTQHDQALITEIAPLMPKSTGSDFYHESGFGQQNCGTTPPLPSGIVTFDDTCSHLHIQVPAGSP